MSQVGSNIGYRVNAKVTTDEFLVLLQSSTLAERRPVQDRACIEGMMKNSNLVVSAWYSDEGDFSDENGRKKLVGIARSVTDFHFACYLTDLAVDKNFLEAGVGLKLQQITQEQVGSRCSLILVAAPSANEYYSTIGFEKLERKWQAWILPPERRLKKS